MPHIPIKENEKFLKYVCDLPDIKKTMDDEKFSKYFDKTFGSWPWINFPHYDATVIILMILNLVECDNSEVKEGLELLLEHIRLSGRSDCMHLCRALQYLGLISAES